MLPTAPIPVHTAYAVPNGSDRSASAINPKLNAIAMTVATVGQNRVSPSEYFSPSAQPTSSRPAPRSASHAFTALSLSWKLRWQASSRRVGHRDGTRAQSSASCGAAAQPAHRFRKDTPFAHHIREKRNRALARCLSMIDRKTGTRFSGACTG
jgi:hypothetical protein